MKRLMKYSAAIFIVSNCYALDQNACSKMLNNGLYKKYKYGGVDQPLTKATKEHGMTKATSVTSTEGSTAILDPKYWSNITTSETQATSSSGDCSLIGLKKIKENRDKYIAQNLDEVLKEASQGSGEHLEVLASFSLCDASAYESFSGGLRENFEELLSAQNSDKGSVIDGVVERGLIGKCFSYKTIIL